MRNSESIPAHIYHALASENSCRALTAISTDKVYTQRQLKLIEDAKSNYKKYGFDALIYLNMVDANIDGPDYSLQSPNDFSSFYETEEASEL